MILTTVERLKNYLQKNNKTTTIEFIDKIYGEGIECGRHDIDENCFANVFINVGVENDKILESHKKYIDVQIILEGKEEMLYKDVEQLTPKCEYNQADDYILYDASNCVQTQIQRGDVVIFYPEDAHKLYVAKNQKESKKAVLKIKV